MNTMLPSLTYTLIVLSFQELRVFPAAWIGVHSTSTTLARARVHMHSSLDFAGEALAGVHFDYQPELPSVFREVG